MFSRWSKLVIGFTLPGQTQVNEPRMLSRTHIQTLVLLLLTFGFAASARPARAIGQEACNETSFVLYLSTGIPEGKHTRTEGWVRLRPGQCRIILPAPFHDAPYYTYARSSKVHGGGRHQWGGQKALCVDETGNFSLDGTQKCTALGLQTRNFSTIDVKPPEGGKTVFSEPSDYGNRAELAGIQRLLKDNGYPMRAIDGYDGRRTRRAVSKFLSAHKISPRPEHAALIDVLERAARENLGQTGLQVCNKTPLPVWTAYVRRKGRNWESRGWWSIAPNACTALLTGRLEDKSVYLYAGLMDGKKERILSAAKDTYCVSDVLFAITGKGKCAQRGYEKRAFALYKNANGKGLTITLTPNDFGKTDVLAGLRR
jgi:uncharacterized membrane protein